MNFAAVDLGAESGRVVRGRFDGERVSLDVAHRFDNRPVRLPDGLRWNPLGLLREIVAALRGVDGPLAGVAVDTWGVDYALLDDGGRVLGLPFHYRDSRTDGMVTWAHERVPREELYAVTGIQTMPINTVHQLDRLLAVRRAGQRGTNASTTGLLDARSGTWARALIERLGLPAAPFAAAPVEPGVTLGPLLAHHEVSAPVHLVASHDTASAYVAAPVRGVGGGGAVVRDVVAARVGAGRAGAEPPGVRVQPHQRARGRRHDPAAAQRHGAMACAAVRDALERVLRGAGRARGGGAGRRPVVRPRRRESAAAWRHAGADRRRVRGARSGSAW